MTAPIDTLRAGAATMGVALSDAQGEQLLAYGTLMLKWNKVYNLTALRDPASVLTHHLLDSLARARRDLDEWWRPLAERFVEIVVSAQTAAS